MTKRYLGNKHHMEVHDLRNEKPLCQIPEIKSKHKVYFDSLKEAHGEGYDNCHWCTGTGSLGGSVDGRLARGPIEPERDGSQPNRGG